MHSISSRQHVICSLFSVISFLPVTNGQSTGTNPWATSLFQSTYQTVPSSICGPDIVVTPDMTPASAATLVADGEPGPYLYRPPQVPLDVDGYPIAPACLELEQVHVYVRHGASAYQ